MIVLKLLKTVKMIEYIAGRKIRLRDSKEASRRDNASRCEAQGTELEELGVWME
jgi:hypothetical protein